MKNPRQSCHLMESCQYPGCYFTSLPTPLFGHRFVPPNLLRFVDVEKDAGLMLLKRLCSTTSTMELLLASTGVDCADVGAKAYDLGDDD